MTKVESKKKDVTFGLPAESTGKKQDAKKAQIFAEKEQRGKTPGVLNTLV